jgi:two-component system, NtrC family, sensor kinase
MGFENVIAFIFLYYLRRQLKTKEIPEKWRQPINWGLIIVVSLAILAGSGLVNELLIKFLSILLISYIVYNIFTHPEFSGTKSLVYAALPLIAVSVVGDIFELAFPAFFKTWDKVFDVASFFAFIWLVAMYITYRKQKKALLAEKIKALEREKEFQITQTLKAKLEVDVAERTAELVKQKEELEKALEELKSAQAQLIQSEKMASLGELTAGIAHEIQNPLNFVNNFSEVSQELIDEMNQELESGDLEEVKAIALDIKQNLEKIHHHGSRADNIVKGMLLHSRTSMGEKTQTDINLLADEYLRLSYHGLRAKDKTFNAEFKTDLGTNLPKINIVPQDIGRVLLNLINNAFYAVNDQRKKNEDSDYKPSVTVSTAINEKGNKVILKVADNGPGIPKQMKDKIFQPFFTTKPTGQGTGLGLSLSYDIVKAHGGELKVESPAKEGKGLPTLSNGQAGTVFIVTLPI